MRISSPTPRPRFAERTRRFVVCTFCLLVCAIAGLVKLGAHAQTATAQQSKSGATPQQIQPARAQRRVTPLRSADTPQGSRVTVTADAPLSDYAAYRSGDRFIVVVPGAAGGGGGGVSGRGFTGADVQRRGNDLVYSFKLQPGAKARVNQRFNRLDVVIDAPGSAAANAANNAGAANTATDLNAARTPAGANDARAEAANPAYGTDDTARAAARERAAEALAARRAAAATSFAAPLAAPATPVDASASPTPETAATPAGQPTPQTTPQTTPADDQIASAQPPPAAGSAVLRQAPSTQTPAFGAIVTRYWGAGAVLLALLLGLGLFFATRGRGDKVELPAASEAALDADEGVGPVKVIKKVHTEETAVAVAPAPTKLANADAAIEHSAVTEAITADAARPAAAESAAAGDLDADFADVVAPAATIASGAAETAVADEPRPAREVVSATPAPADSGDAEIVSGEVRKLLAGDPYDERAIRGAGTHARVLAAAELLAAIVSRDALRRDAARRAYVDLGFYEAAVGDLQRASASAERASAARALGHVGSTAATAALVGALDDRSPEVRRAAVEALAELRDPAAVPALEAARTREKRRDMPRQLINRAIAACSSGKRASAVAAADLTSAPSDAASDRSTAHDEPDAAIPATARTAEDQTTHAAATEAAPVVFAPTEAEPAAPAPEVVSPETTAAELVVPEIAPERLATAEAADEATLSASHAVEAERAAPAAEPAAPPIEVAPSHEADQHVAHETSHVEAAVADEPAAEVTSEIAAEVMLVAPETAFEVAPEPEAPTTGIALYDSASAPRSAEAEQIATEESVGDTAAQAGGASLAFVVEDAPSVAPAVEPEDASPFVQAEISEHDRAASDRSDLVTAPDASDAATDAAAPGTVALEVAPFESAAALEPADSLSAETAHADADLAAPEAELPQAPTAEQTSETGIELLTPSTDDGWFDLEVTDDATEHHAESARPAADYVDAGLLSPEPLHAERSLAEYQPAPAEHAALPPEAPGVGYEFGAVALDPVTVIDPATDFSDADPLADRDRASDGGVTPVEPVATPTAEPVVVEPVRAEVAPPVASEIASLVGDEVSPELRSRLSSPDAGERARGVAELGRLRTDEAERALRVAFDDPASEVRAAAALALYDAGGDRTGAFTQALREATPERRRNIGAALAASGLAADAINNLAGESREKTYEAFSLLFLMAKAGEFGSLLKAIESNPSTETRLAVVKLLALSGQPDVLPAFRRLAVRGSLPTEVRSAVMEAVYQISNQGAA